MEGLSFGAGGRGQFLPASPNTPSSTCEHRTETTESLSHYCFPLLMAAVNQRTMSCNTW